MILSDFFENKKNKTKQNTKQKTKGYSGYWDDCESRFDSANSDDGFRES